MVGSDAAVAKRAGGLAGAKQSPLRDADLYVCSLRCCAHSALFCIRLCPGLLLLSAGRIVSHVCYRALYLSVCIKFGYGELHVLFQIYLLRGAS